MTTTGIYWITEFIAMGRFPDHSLGKELLKEAITHILNVSEDESMLKPSPDGFHEVIHHRVADEEKLEERVVLDCLDDLHAMLTESESKLYIHCLAGRTRSATVLWLYLIACGMEPDDARRTILQRTTSALPGHPDLITDELVEAVRRHGAEHFQPVSRPEILTPA